MTALDNVRANGRSAIDVLLSRVNGGASAPPPNPAIVSCLQQVDISGDQKSLPHVRGNDVIPTDLVDEDPIVGDARRARNIQAALDPETSEPIHREDVRPSHQPLANSRLGELDTLGISMEEAEKPVDPIINLASTDPEKEEPGPLETPSPAEDLYDHKGREPLAGRNSHDHNSTTLSEAQAPSELLSAVLDYANGGLAVFPVRVWYDGNKWRKMPITAHGHKDATTDPGAIRAMWSAHPDASIGAVPASAQFVVIDVDVGAESNLATVNWLSALPPTRTIRTPSGGRHLWYFTFAEFSNSKPVPCVDIRSANGWVVLPPSPGYTIEKDIPEALLPMEYNERLNKATTGAKAPRPEPVDTPANVRRAADYLLHRAPIAIEGRGGDQVTYTVAAELVRNIGLSDEMALDLMLKLWNERCEPPWDENELAVKVRNAAAYGKDAPGWTPVSGDIFPPWAGKEAKKRKRGWKRQSAAETTPENIEWVWRGWLAKAKFSILAGMPEDGKTTLAIDFAARATLSGPWPDGTRSEPGDVWMQSTEDDWRDTIVPRFLAAGGNPDRFFRIHEVDGRPFDAATDMAILKADMLEAANPAGIILDPVIALAPVKSGETAQVRHAFIPFLGVLEELRVWGLGITHFGKGTRELTLLERLLGSQAWGAQARVVCATVFNKDTERRRVIRVKGNNLKANGGGYDYRLGSAEVPGYPGIEEQARIEWAMREISGTAERLYM
jgi:hypothetical protein